MTGASVHALEKRCLLTATLQADGSEAVVNSYRERDQTQPVIAMDPHGDTIVVWQSFGQDGSEWGIYAQRYARDGSAMGSEFRVNTTTQGSQTDPSVAIDAAGNFVIAWRSDDQTSLLAQRFTANGKRMHGEFHVIGESGNPVGMPAVAMAPDGRFIIAWPASALTADFPDVDVNIYRASGERVRSINLGLGGGVHRDLSAAMNSAGDFVIGWGQPGDTGAGSGVYFRRFRADGNSLDPEPDIPVDQSQPQGPSGEPPVQFLSSPSVGIDDARDVVVAWEKRILDPIAGTSTHSVNAKLFDSARVGRDLGSIQTFFGEPQSQLSTVAMNAAGKFVIGWKQNAEEFRFAEYDHAGAGGGEGRLDRRGLTAASQPALAIDAEGNFVATWSAGNDSMTDVYVRAVTDQGPFASLHNGTLTVEGTRGDDIISIAAQGSRLLMVVNGQKQTFVASRVKRIRIQGHDGNDAISVGHGIAGVNASGGAGNDTLVGGDGNDTLRGLSGADRLDGGAGDDVLRGGKHNDVLVGGDGADRLHGDDGDDLLDGGNGRDRLSGDGDNDTLLGGNLSDVLYGGSGEDRLDGGNHADRLYGGAGIDRLSGGAGDDWLQSVDAYQDHVDGGEGRDTAMADPLDILDAIEIAKP
jgi:hypothetical protein